MENYKKKSNIEFKMPEFTEYDWNKLLNNICVVSFVQGLAVGTTIYNNYVIIPSTENKQFVSESDLYYIAYKKEKTTNESGEEITKIVSDGYYHRLSCPKLENDGDELSIIGYDRKEFLKQTAINPKTGEDLKKVDAYGNVLSKAVYYYNHDEKACYYCVVNASDSKFETKKELDEKYNDGIINEETHQILIDKYKDPQKLKIKAYYNALAREKRKLTKQSEYINGSGEQTKEDRYDIYIKP